MNNQWKDVHLQKAFQSSSSKHEEGIETKSDDVTVNSDDRYSPKTSSRYNKEQKTSFEQVGMLESLKITTLASSIGRKNVGSRIKLSELLQTIRNRHNWVCTEYIGLLAQIKELFVKENTKSLAYHESN